MTTIGGRCAICLQSLDANKYAVIADEPNIRSCVECMETWLSKHRVSLVARKPVAYYLMYTSIGEPPRYVWLKHGTFS